MEKENHILQLMLQEKSRQELAQVISMNEQTGRFGLELSEADAKLLVECRNKSLEKHQRIEFKEGILEKLIFAFCDSPYLNQDNYRENLERLVDIFYEFKNECGENLTDDELLTFMQEQFDGVCCGDLEYLEGTCLELFADAVRAGYRGYQQTGGRKEFERLDPVMRWDHNLFMAALRELFWE